MSNKLTLGMVIGNLGKNANDKKLKEIINNKKAVKDGEWRRIQFIKNLKATYVNKAFRKYNVIFAWYNAKDKNWIHYTTFGIHYIPDEYVKIYNH